MKFLHSIEHKSSSPAFVMLASFVSGALGELSLGLCRGVLLSYPASVGMLARSTSASFRADLSMPTDECVGF
jgi:hypothetical protein